MSPSRITRKLKHELRHDRTLRDLPLRIAREFTLDDPDTGEELGRIDLCWLHGHHDEAYLAFECKRLNVSFASGKRSLAGDYVGEKGMERFLSGKYSAGHEDAGMLGYVMDGKVAGAIEAVDQSTFMALLIEKFQEIPGWLFFSAFVGLLGLYLWRRRAR